MGTSGLPHGKTLTGQDPPLMELSFVVYCIAFILVLELVGSNVTPQTHSYSQGFWDKFSNNSSHNVV